MGAFITGLGEGAANYGTQQRSLENQRTITGMQQSGETQRLAMTHWENQRQALAGAIQQAAMSEPVGSPLRHQYLDAWTRLLGEKPGAKLDAYHTEFSQLQNHARAADQEGQIASAATRAASQPISGPPNPASPGQTPGATPTIPPMPGPSGMPEQRLGGPLAAQPPTSPVQPITQTGGAGGQNAASPFPDTAVSASAVPTAAPTGAGAVANQGSAGPSQSVPSIDDLWNSPMSPAERAAMAPMHYGPQFADAISKIPGIDKFPLLATEAKLQAYGLKPTPMAGLIRPINVPGLIPAPPGATSALDGSPISTPYVRVQRSLIDNTEQYYPEYGTTSPTVMPDPNSKTGFSRVVFDTQGQEISRVTGATPPGQFVPKVTKSEKETVVDFGDHKEIWPVGTETVTQGVIPGQDPKGNATPAPTSNLPHPLIPGPSVPPARNIGEKTLTPNQEMTSEQKLGQYQLAKDRAQMVIQNAPMLASLIESGKLELELDTDGFLKAIVNRSMPMNAREAQLASDFITLSEDINVLRGPLGATGFRGPEAFQRLQAQKGQLLARPEITVGVLQNTIQALNRQIGPIQKRVGVSPPAAQPTPNEQPTPAGPAMSKTAQEYLKKRGKL